MTRVIALIDGEHYPPVVRFALDRIRSHDEVVAAVFLGGTEKVDEDEAQYGVPLVTGRDSLTALREAIAQYRPEQVVDLSDEPVVSSQDRFLLASAALSLGVGYRGADFEFTPPRELVTTVTPTLAMIGTGKRVGKTAVSAHAARLLKAAGRDIVVLAMGRGGPAEPELIHGDRVRLSTADLLGLARQGAHAASDNYEDAVMSRVATVGCRRCGGGMAGETFFSNVPEGAVLADGLGKELIILEGSGAALPPVHADASVLVVGAGRGESYVSDYFGPFRLQRADAVVIAGAEEPIASQADVEAVREAVRRRRPSIPVVSVSFRPSPIEPVEGHRVMFVTTAPAEIIDKLSRYLETEHHCEVVAVSSHLSNRRLLRADIERHSGTFDLLLTELKAAAIDVVAEAGEIAGVPTVLCDNVPVPTDGSDLDEVLLSAASRALDRGSERSK